VTAGNLITDVLASPLSPNWTIEGLAEQLLTAIAARRPEESQDLSLDAEPTTDRQSHRLLRPLLACLATKSQAETGIPVSIYGGQLSFKRPGPEGPVWILGQFENRPGTVRVSLRRSCSPPGPSQARTAQPCLTTTDNLRLNPSPPNPGTPFDDRTATATEPDQLSLVEKRRIIALELLTAAQRRSNFSNRKTYGWNH